MRTALAVMALSLLAACSGSSTPTHQIGTSAGPGGSLSPSHTSVADGKTATFTVTPDSGNGIAGVTGCAGTLSGTTYTTGPITADCTVTATFGATHTVTASAGQGGSLSPSSATVLDGDTATFTVTADAGHAIASVEGCGGALSGSTYTTGAITADCQVTASFVAVHTVTATAGSGGSISPGTASVVDGDSTQFTVTADSGHVLVGVTGCAGTLSGTTYTTGSITADCTVTASFTALHTVTATAGTGGTINPGSASVQDGQTVAFTVRANSGYGVASVTGCGGSLSGTTYTTGRITADCQVTASFGLLHTVTASAGSGGSIDPGSAPVLDGATASFTVTPDAGFQIASVTGCGGTLSGTTYTTAAVSADCTVTASFDAVPVDFTSGQAATVVIGQTDFTSRGAPYPPTATSLNTPYGNPVVYNGVLYVSSYYDERVLGYDSIPTANGASADFVIGPSDFVTRGSGFLASSLAADGDELFVDNYEANVRVYSPVPTAADSAPGNPSPSASFTIDASSVGGFYLNDGISIGGGRMVITDQGYHRVLLWNATPSSNTAPDLVLGEPDFTTKSTTATASPTASTFNNPSGVWTDGQRIVINDLGNNRVLIWNSWPTSNGQAADLVLGQSDFTSKSANQGLSSPTAATLRKPQEGVFVHGNQLFVTDTGNRRVLVWNSWPTQNDQPADVVLGQADFTTVTQGPTQTRMSAPDGLFLSGTQLIVTDNYDNRALIFDGALP